MACRRGAVVLRRLVREEVHAVALGEALLEPGVELGRRERDRHAALDVEGDHPVEEQVGLALGDPLDPAVLRSTTTGSWARCSRTKSQAPSSVPASSPEPLLELVGRLVGGDDEVLLDGACW